MRHCLGFAALVALALTNRDAAAQVRWDVSAGAGVAGRFLSSRPAGEEEPSVGPSFEAQGHVVVFPLVRVGAYLHIDESPVAARDADVTRDIVAGGLDLRLVSPWPLGNTRVYLRAGVGEADVIVPSHLTLERASVPPASAHFTEVPLALGVAYRPHHLFWLTAEAGARLGFAFGGGTYSSGSDVGDDSVAVYLHLGVMWGR